MVDLNDGLFFSTKESEHLAMKGQGGNFNAYYQVKEDNLKRLFNSNT
jgi:hypothetical protein